MHGSPYDGIGYNYSFNVNVKKGDIIDFALDFYQANDYGDDDVARVPNIVINDVSVSEGNFVIKNLTFQVKFNKASSKSVF